MKRCTIPKPHSQLFTFGDHYSMVMRTANFQIHLATLHKPYSMVTRRANFQTPFTARTNLEMTTSEISNCFMWAPVPEAF